MNVYKDCGYKRQQICRTTTDPPFCPLPRDVISYFLRFVVLDLATYTNFCLVSKFFKERVLKDCDIRDIQCLLIEGWLNKQGSICFCVILKIKEIREKDFNDLFTNKNFCMHTGRLHTMCYAILNRRYDILDQYLLAKQFSKQEGIEVLAFACGKGCLTSTKKLLEVCDDIYEKRRIYCRACSSGNLKLVKYLESNGIKNLSSGLISACFSGHVAIVRHLLEDSSLDYNDIYTAFRKSIRSNKFAVVKTILEKLVIIDKKLLCLSDAVDTGSKYLFRMIYEDKNVQNVITDNYERFEDSCENSEVLEEACAKGFTPVVRFLLKDGRFPYTFSCFYNACKEGHMDIINILLNTNGLKREVEVTAVIL
jgi:hypothetical protein